MKFLSIFALILSITSALWAQTKKAFQVDQVEVQYALAYEGTAIQVNQLIQQALERYTGYFPPFQFRHRYRVAIVSPPEWALIRKRYNIPGWSGGVYLPAQRKIFLPGANVTQSLFTLEHTVLHELGHLILHAYMDSSRVPRWYHEGFAEFVSKGNIQLADGIRIANAIWAKQVLMLADMDSLFDFSPGRAQLAYIESLSAFIFLLQQIGGPEQLAHFHFAVRNKGWSVALHEFTGMDAADFEVKWYRWLEKAYRWFVFANVDFWVWIMAVMGFIAIYYTIRRRNRQRLAQWAIQEEVELKDRQTHSIGNSTIEEEDER